MDELATACLVQAETNIVLNIRNHTVDEKGINDYGRVTRHAPVDKSADSSHELEYLDESNPTIAKLQHILMSYCPGDCNGRGKCMMGECSCQKGKSTRC